MSNRYDGVNLNFKTRTDNKPDYFDQILALPQEAINRNFKAVYERNPDIRNVKWESKSFDINLTGALDCPRVLLNVGNPYRRNSLYYVVRWVHFDIVSIKIMSPLINISQGSKAGY